MRAADPRRVRRQRASSEPRRRASVIRRVPGMRRVAVIRQVRSIHRVPDPMPNQGRSVRKRRDRAGRSVQRARPLRQAAADRGSPPTTERLPPTRCSCACSDRDPKRSSGRDRVVADGGPAAHRQGRRSPSTRRPGSHPGGYRSCRWKDPPCRWDSGAAIVHPAECRPPCPRESIARPPLGPVRAWCPRRHVPVRGRDAHPTRVDEAGRRAANRPPGSPGSGQCQPLVRPGGSAWRGCDART